MTADPEQTMRELVQSVEWAFYANRFRNETFVIYFSRAANIERYLMELGVLESYGIRLTVLLERKCRRPARLIKQIPCLRRRAAQPAISITGQVSKPLAAQIAVSEHATKLIIVSPDCAGLLVDRGLITVEQLPELLQDRRRSRVNRALLGIAGQALEGGVHDVVFLEDRPGTIFEEVFTFDGAGLMLTRRPHERVRRATIEDVPEIYWLLQPGMERGEILPIEYDEVLKSYRYFAVYVIDDHVVACGRLIRYGDSAEIAKFATLPRYRNSGKARSLLKQLVQSARKLRLTGVFGLTLSEPMSKLFHSSGFRRISRRRLPEEWKKGYDFTRRSMAYWKDIDLPKPQNLDLFVENGS